MAKKETKQNFLGGAAILAAAVVAVKLIGAVYKIPLGNLLGTQGYAHFMVSYDIYNVLLTVSTAGLPLALSKLVSEAGALGRENEKRKIFRTSLLLFFTMGSLGTLLMACFPGQLADFMRDSLAMYSIRALSPAVVCVCLMAAIRGYTQGQGNMKPTAISQILEAACKLGIGLSLAWFFLQQGKGVEISAAGAIFGVTIGTAASLVFLTGHLVRRRHHVESLDVPASSGTLLKRLLVIGIPITISNSAMAIITLLDTRIVLERLQILPGVTQMMATDLFGRYKFCMNLFNLPGSFVYPVIMSLIPAVSAAVARRDGAGANRIVSSGFRLIALLALPAGIGLSVLAGPILRLLYPSQLETAIAAEPLMEVLGIASIFVCVMILTNAILQSQGKERIPIYTMVAGGVVKIVTNYILVGNPEIGIAGAPISTLLCYLVIAGLNLFFVYRASLEKPRYAALFLKPIVASALMGLSARVTYQLVSGSCSNALSTFVAIGVAVAVYGILVLALRILTAEDLKSLPGGAKIAQRLHIR
ncbi:MAG: polysaccharide biosynthesis protein [Oscillospiraceae bacterium]